MDKPEQKKVFFRNNLIGGFNKADVVAYIAQQNQEQIAELDDLRSSLSAAEDAAQRAKNQITVLSGALNRSNAELAKVQSEAAALHTELEQVQAKLSAAETAKAEADERFQALFTGLRSAASDLCTVPLTTGDDAKIDALNQHIDALTAENRELHAALDKLAGFQSAIRSLLGDLAGSQTPPADDSSDS